MERVKYPEPFVTGLGLATQSKMLKQSTSQLLVGIIQDL